MKASGPRAVLTAINAAISKGGPYAPEPNPRPVKRPPRPPIQLPLPGVK